MSDDPITGRVQPADNGSTRNRIPSTRRGRNLRGRAPAVPDRQIHVPRHPQQLQTPQFELQGIIRPAQFYKLGNVIRFPLHKMNMKEPPGNDPPASSESLVKIGRWVHSKYRSLIIVELSLYHCTTIPIHTNSGNGLKFRPSKDEYIGVRDSLDRRRPPPPSESKHRNILVTRLPEFLNLPGPVEQQPHYFRPKSYAHLNFPVVFDYTIACEVQGRIEDNRDLVRLVRTYYRSCSWKH